MTSAFLLPALIVLGAWWFLPAPLPAHWTEPEIKLLRSLWLGSLPELPADPSNKVGDDERAAKLGYRLFFDNRLSANSNVACATCHRPELLFTDGLPVAVGTQLGRRNTPGLIGVASNPWFFWDGRKDSQWSQALGPLENELEHAGNRMQYVRLLAHDNHYRGLYESIFGKLPDISDSSRFPTSASPVGNAALQAAWKAMHPDDRIAISTVFSNIGKSIAAYERKLKYAPAPFDLYVEKVLQDGVVRQPGSLSRDEVAGLRLFIGKAQCINCHNGPLFTNNAFHNTGVLSAPGQTPSIGRVEGLRTAQQDPFNCLGKFSDAKPQDCAELRFAKGGDVLIGAHKTPSLRNVALTAPYMHAGQLANLKEVVQHYNEARPAMVGHNEAKQLNLRPVEQHQLIRFLRTLTGPPATSKEWLEPPDKLPVKQ